MAEPILLRVLTEAGVAIEDQAVSVVAPGEVGYLGVLRNHAPLVTTLTSGTLAWRRPDGSREARRIGAGLLEVAENRVTLLTSHVEQPEPQADT